MFSGIICYKKGKYAYLYHTCSLMDCAKSQILVPLETGRWTVCLLVVLSQPLCEIVTILSLGFSFYH